MPDPLQLSADGHELTFQRVPLHFITRGGIPNVFADYKEKTLRDTLRKKRYKNLFQAVEQRNLSDRDEDMPLGTCLLGLKQRGDSFYNEFLNDYGDKEYCKFAIQGDLAATKGLYCYTVDGEIRYIGRCRDSFKKRVNQGYGVIHPKNCYRDGQATNCHLNSLIAKETGEIEFWVCPLERDMDIEELERRLVKDPDRRLEWNIALKNKQPEVRDPPNWVVPIRVAGAVVALLGVLLVVASFCRSETPE
jgi:hypothetical protein